MKPDGKDSEAKSNKLANDAFSSGDRVPIVFTGQGLLTEDGFPITPELSVGDVVGDKYTIRKLLGVGASGSVYEAEHKEIGRRVAIKVVHRALATRSDIVARFRIEARVCGRIRNAHVGQVYDVGRLADGLPFMVMELQEGKSLAARLRQGPLPIPAAIEITKQLLSALSAAQELGVIHRDVKPGNVMIAKGASSETIVKLVDFGISKPIADDVASRSGRISLRSVTLEGAIVGSPDYMPPEQLRGREIDRRADLYATGVVLYEMVTGRLPFNAPSLTELMASILRDPVTPPSKIRADCPPELEEIILKAIARSKADRFQTAAEMTRALEAVVAAYQYPVGAAVWTLDQQSPAQMVAVQPLDSPSEKEGYVVESALQNTPMHRILSLPRWQLATAIAAVVASTGIVVAVGTSNRDTVRVKMKVTAASPQSKRESIPPVDLRLLEKSELGEQSPEPDRDREAQAASAKGVDDNGRNLASRGKRNKAIKARVSSNAKIRRVVSSVKAKKPAETASSPSSETAQTQSVAEIVSQAAAAYVRGQVPVARSLYAKAVELAPRNPAAWRGLGMASSRMGQNQDAANAFRRYLQLSPSAPDATSIRRKLEQLPQ